MQRKNKGNYIHVYTRNLKKGNKIPLQTSITTLSY